MRHLRPGTPVRVLTGRYAGEIAPVEYRMQGKRDATRLIMADDWAYLCNDSNLEVIPDDEGGGGRHLRIYDRVIDAGVAGEEFYEQYTRARADMIKYGSRWGYPV